MIKVPATPAGLDALEDLCAAGISLNVTLIFTSRQYQIARDNVLGMRRRKIARSIQKRLQYFVSRLDQYSEKHLPKLSSAAQGESGILNAKRIWRENQDFWANKKTPLQQEMIFASTGEKSAKLDPWKYVAAFAGSDIETNPPATNDATQASGKTFTRAVDQNAGRGRAAEIDSHVDFEHLEKHSWTKGFRNLLIRKRRSCRYIAAKAKRIRKVIMSDSTTTVSDSADLLRIFVAERSWEKFHSPKNLAMLGGNRSGRVDGAFPMAVSRGLV